VTVRIPCIAALTLVLSSILCPNVAAQDVTSLPLFPKGIADYPLELYPITPAAGDNEGAPRKSPFTAADSNESTSSAIHVSSRGGESAPHVIRHPFRAWLALSIAGQAAALADAKTTLDLRHSHPLTFRENDPLARPFVNLPVPPYVASSVGLSAGLSLLAWRLNRSENSWLRHHWWLPQMAQTVVNAECAVHNTRQ
jgi:hypothetical protein